MTIERVHRVSVVIPTFNRRAGLSQVVNPLLDDPSTGEVILVVDGSQDGSLEFLREWSVSEPRIRAIFQENSGQATARQLGVESARFDVVVMLDDDVIPNDRLISGHAKWHVAADRIVVVGYSPTKVPAHRLPGQVSTRLYAQSYENTCAAYEADPGAILTNLWAGNLSMRRLVALEIGLANAPRLPYHEDMQFGIRCELAGVSAVFDRSLLAWHSYDRTLNQFVAECGNSGRARAQLLTEFPDYAGSIHPLSSLNNFQALMVRALATDLIRPITSRFARATSTLAGKLRLWKLETWSIRIVRQVEVYRAFKCVTAPSPRSPATVGEIK